MCYTLTGLPWLHSSPQMCHSLIWCKETMEISRSLGITSFTDYLAIYMIYLCVVVFCPYSKMALYNITIVFKIFALLTCISRMLFIWQCNKLSNVLRVRVTMIHFDIFSREFFSLSHLNIKNLNRVIHW